MVFNPNDPSRPLQDRVIGGIKTQTNPYQVAEFHNYDDVDSDRNAHHHTLGYGTNQAAPGSEFKKTAQLVADQAAELSTLDNRVTTAETDINTLEGQLASTQAEVDAVETDVLNLKKKRQMGTVNATGTGTTAANTPAIALDADLVSMLAGGRPRIWAMAINGSYVAYVGAASAASVTLTVRRFDNAVIANGTTIAVDYLFEAPE